MKQKDAFEILKQGHNVLCESRVESITFWFSTEI